MMIKWPHRLAVRTLAFQAGNLGSNPSEVNDELFTPTLQVNISGYLPAAGAGHPTLGPGISDKRPYSTGVFHDENC